MRSIANGTPSDPMGLLRVVIVGGGFSGTLVAIHLLRQNRSIHVELVDPQLPGRGLAYSTSYEEHLLNVPAIRMSAFGSEPLHFLNWLQNHGRPDADPGMFAPRRLFGTYIQDVLENTVRSMNPESRLHHHFAEAVRISFDGFSVEALLHNGHRLRADKVVLASGNPAPSCLGTGLAGFFESPWEQLALNGLDPDNEVLLIGSGLTAVDAFLMLRAQDHAGRVHMVSRRGKLPQAHRPYRPLPEHFPIPKDIAARGLLRSIRAKIGEAETEGIDWRAVIDSIRPVTNEIWEQMDDGEKLRVLRHLKTWWDIHRHRMAPEIGAKVDEGLRSGQLTIHSGRLKHATGSDEGLQAEISLRSGETLSLLVKRAVNCTGPDVNYLKTTNPLIRFLINTKRALPNANGRGLRTSPQGELIDAEGNASKWLFTLGTPRFGALFETTAVPELRQQAEALAAALLSLSYEPVEITPEVFMAAGI